MSDKNLTSKDLLKYEGNYSEKAFWDKLKKVASKAGAKVVYYALVLFYTLIDPKTPVKYKAIIAGALAIDPGRTRTRPARNSVPCFLMQERKIWEIWPSLYLYCHGAQLYHPKSKAQ